jgi:hypothetical protein
MAGSTTKWALWGLVVCALTPPVLAQRTQKSTAKHSVETSAKPVPGATSSRLLSSDEGLAIIGAALETRHTTHSGGDCSHLVHAIYEQAGFPYPYADSSKLYDGIEDFRQVTHSQPGDLAVWLGHAAIVVNPAQHSFFSSTRSGLRVESYDLEYWKHRGLPRFFRYVKPASPSSPSVTRTATAKLPILHNGESPTPHVVAGDSDDLPNDDSLSSALPTAGSRPRILVVYAPQPKPKQVNETLSQEFDETKRARRGQEVLNLSEPLTVFDHIEVKAVHVKGNQGWAEVNMEGLSSLVAGRAAPKKRSEQQRWVLTRRDADTWELLLPLKSTYLPHDLAVRLLAHQLATLADKTSGAGDSAKDQAQLARTLNLLLER